MPEVSVIMPTYNCGAYLEESIKSALSQPYVDMELIIVDGGSADSTPGILRRYGKDPRVTCIERRGYGISAARNYGISLAKSELIAFLDGDDLFLKDKISRQALFLGNNKRCGVSYTNMIYFNGEAKEIPSTYCHFSGDIFYYLKRNNFIHPSAVMGRKRIFEKSLFNERLATHEDWEFFLRLAARGVRFGFIKEPLTRIRVRELGAQSDTPLMDATRFKVGLMAREYWRDFKKEMGGFSGRGVKAALRYLKFKTNAFLIGFPYRERFNRVPAHNLL